eukprot:g2392.t1
MLRATALTDFLQSACVNGIDSALLFDENGAILGVSSAAREEEAVAANVAAVTANAWETLSSPPSSFDTAGAGQGRVKPLTSLTLELEDGIIVAKVFLHGSKSYLVALRGDSSAAFARAQEQADLLASTLESEFKKLAT